MSPIPSLVLEILKLINALGSLVEDVVKIVFVRQFCAEEKQLPA